MVEQLNSNTAATGITLFGLDDPRQGIVHVVGPEQGLSQPGLLIVCGDSHTSTHGAVGALAFGIGSTEVTHVLATQTLWQRKPQTMRITVDGQLGAGVTAKDVILAIIAKIGTAGATGHVVEYAGSAITRALDGRAADALQHVDRGRRARRHDRAGRRHLRLSRRAAPTRRRARIGIARWRAGGRCRAIPARSSTARSRSTRAEIAPMVTWGTSPQDAAPITGHVPDPGRGARRRAARRHAAGARLYGADAGHAARRHHGRPRLHRLLHQQPHRGSARRRRHRPRAQGRIARAGLGRAGLRPRSRRRPRRRGSTASSPTPDSSGARPAARCVSARTARSSRRASAAPRRPTAISRPPGTGGAHPSDEPGDGGRGGGHRPADRCAAALRRETAHDPVPDARRRRGADRAAERRHRPDHPGALPAEARATEGFGDYLFHDLRFAKDGSEVPEFILNQPVYRVGADHRSASTISAAARRARMRSGRSTTTASAP